MVDAHQQCLAVDLDGKLKSIADEILRTIQRIEDGRNKRPAAKWSKARKLFDGLRQLAREFVLNEVDPTLVNLDSSFAKNLAKELRAFGTAAEHLGFAETLNSTYGNRYFLD